MNFKQMDLLLVYLLICVVFSLAGEIPESLWAPRKRSDIRPQ